MKTIKITRRVREMIDDFSEDETVNDSINRLLDLFEPSVQVYESGKESTNIALDEATLERLKQYKLTTSENHSDTILRLLMQLE